jgi:predicted alpha/beta-fold hydrolase
VSGAARLAACDPPWWARGAHAQTIFGHVLPCAAPQLSRSARREVELDDGDRLVVHELDGVSGVRVVLLHGLSGDVDSDYMRGAARALQERGHSVWAVNHRGCGLGRGLATRPYHSGRSADLRAVLRESRALAPSLAHVVVGFSISGNIALLAASEELEPLADAVLAVNPPIDLAHAADAVHAGRNRLYELRFVARLRAAARHFESLGAVCARAPLSRWHSLREFDDRFTAPVSGFASAADYYAACSSAPRLGAIRIPTAILSSYDDPLVAPGILLGARRSASTSLHLELHGGHMGYVSRRGRWIDGAVVHFVELLVARR